ncbi:GPO family capsid scaffolding protein [Novosphingobium sp.]|uniref:GPO family capsid scaffolding protein n=1 Tax=Novosphingobium sp. TaxID=1874826 RepID=UPI0038B6B7B1
MATAPKFFRIAVEGDTTDGRKITRQDILDCAETFDPQLYGVRVNLEHYRGIVPGGPFDMLGDVTAVKAEEIDLPVGNATQRVMALFAQIKPLEQLVAFNKKKQKLFSSIEIGQNCRGTGKAYLLGCAVTDSPASFGTEALEFARQHPAFLASRKGADDSLICQAHEIPADVFAEEAQSETAGVLAGFKALLEGFTGKPKEPAAPATAVVEPAAPGTPAAPEATAFAAFGALLGQMTGVLDKLSTEVTTIAASTKATADKLAALEQTVETTPHGSYRQRSVATGGEDAGARTDC